MTSLKVYLKTRSLSVISEAYPLVIELSHQGVNMNIDTPYHLPEKNFDAVQGKAVVCRYTLLSKEKIAEINYYVSRELGELRTIIDFFEGKKEPYTVNDVVNNYYSKGTDGEFEDYVIRFVRILKRRGGKLGVYSNLLKQIEIYNKQVVMFNKRNMPLRFEDITREWVRSFYNHISNLRLSQSAKNSYIRVFNNICLSASREGLLSNRLFLKGKIVGDMQNPETVVGTDIISKVEHADLKDDETLSLTRDIFLFSYYADCMPFGKLVALKGSDIHDGMIWYPLDKDNRQQVSIAITPVLNEIVNRYKTGNDYVFPLLRDSVVDAEDQIRVQLLRYNRNLKKLSMQLKLDVVLYSNIMMKIAGRKTNDNNILISVSVNGNMRAVKITCPQECNVEEMVLMNLKKVIGC